MTENSAEVQPAESSVNWSEITDFNSAMQALAAADMIDAAEELGDGFVLQKDKSQLLNVPFVVLGWKTQKDKDTGNLFMTVRCIGIPGNNKGFDDKKFLINDGGTGIYDQLKKVEERREWDSTQKEVHCVMPIRNGLRSSTYFVDKDGKPTTDESKKAGKATTYYLT